MKRFGLLLLLFPLLPLTAGDVSGIVVDGKTGESIPGVNVILSGTDKGAATNMDGFFIIREVKPRTIKLLISHIAYKDTLYSVTVTEADEYLGRIPLNPAPISAKAIDVTAARSTIIHKETDISSLEVDPVVLREMPQFNKDVFKLIQYSPSVTISDPLSPQYYVRGSDPGENLVQLDGMTIYNPQHFMASNAIFNPYAIKNIEMLVGGFDAEYGGRNASIMNITTREGHHSETHGEFRPSSSGFTGAVEFPIRGGTAMLSGRALTDLVTRVFMNSPNVMMDFNGAYRTHIGKTNLRFSGFYARDYMNYNIDNLLVFFPLGLFDTFEEGFITNTTNRAFGLKMSTLLQPDLLLEAHVYHSGSTVDNNTYFGYSVKDTTGNLDVALDFRTRIENSISDNTAKADLVWYIFGHQSLKLGTEINQLDFANQLGRQDGPPAPIKNQEQLQAFFVQDEIEMGPAILKLGLRQSRSLSRTNWTTEPRISFRLKFGETVLKAAYGHYVQYLTTMDSKGDEFVQFLDYYNSLGDLKPISSVHHIVGIEGKLLPRLDYSVTAYYKDLERLYRSTYNSNWLADQSGSLIEAGSGKAYGFEVVVKGEAGRFSGWTSYSWSRGLRSYPSILDGKEVLFDGDQPHNLKSVLMYKLTPDITASSTFQFTSGFPRTWETGQVMQYSYNPLNNNLGVYPTSITPERNNVRYPPRMVWDIGWKKQLRTGFGHDLAEYLGGLKAEYTMTIRNVLFLHRNPIYYFYIPNYGYYGFDSEYLPSISAGYTITF